MRRAGRGKLTWLKEKNKGAPAILTVVERQARLVMSRKVEDFEAETTDEAIRAAVSEFGASRFKSMTFDNGAKFSEVDKLEKLGIKIYFAHAYSSWERGSHENDKGVLCEFIPKGESIKKYSAEEIRTYEVF